MTELIVIGSATASRKKEARTKSARASPFTQVAYFLHPEQEAQQSAEGQHDTFAALVAPARLSAITAINTIALSFFMDFSPLKNQFSFCELTATSWTLNPEQHFWWRFLNTKQPCFEESVSSAMPDTRNNFDRIIKPSCRQIEIGSQNEVLRKSNSHRGCVPLRSDSYLKRTARHPVDWRGFSVARFYRGLAAGMAAMLHVCHRP